MKNKNPKVDMFIQKEKRWKEEFETLREIILTHPVIEEVKWGVPCYTYNQNNVLLMHGFKEYCAILFVKGSLLQDEKHILISQTTNTQASRQIRYKNVNEIIEATIIINSYIEEALNAERNGGKVTFKPTSEFNIPSEFQQNLDESEQLWDAFHLLTQGRQRAYLLYFGSPTLSKTKSNRIKKYIPHILNGKGLHDKEE